MGTLDDAMLEHHGIKGMRWGVRRSRGSGGTVGGKSKGGHESSTDAARAKEIHTKIKTGGTHTVSNQELQHLVTRMNLEQQLSKLSSNKGTTSKGAKVAREILLNVGKQHVTKVLSEGLAEITKSK